MLEQLRNKSKEILSSRKWLSCVSYGEREVIVHTDGFYCNSMNQFDPEFTTNDIETAINYLYPQ